MNALWFYTNFFGPTIIFFAPGNSFLFFRQNSHGKCLEKLIWSLIGSKLKLIRMAAFCFKSILFLLHKTIRTLDRTPNRLWQLFSIWSFWIVRHVKIMIQISHHNHQSFWWRHITLHKWRISIKSMVIKPPNNMFLINI